MALQRRDFLGAAALLVASPRVLFAQAETQRRFVFVIQRGAADGLNIVVPQGDPAYAPLRRELAIESAQATKLDDMFGLHPALAETARLHANGQALFVHAVASPYRDRSHFDGQNVLESGGAVPYQVRDGWMNRLVTLLPRPDKEAIALSPAIPLALRGAVQVASYAPAALPQASDDLLVRVEQLYAADPQLHAVWSSAMDAHGMATGIASARRQDPAALARLAASFLVRPDGPRLAMIETGGWDTHSAQAGRLTAQLRALDTLVATLRDGMADAWNQTVVLVATEFGRTAAANGTGGTDHGTGAVAMLLGGAVQGGRVMADWPGLAPGQLYEGRDLRPTTALDALIAQAAAETFRLDPQLVARTLFPVAPPQRLRVPALVRA